MLFTYVFVCVLLLLFFLFDFVFFSFQLSFISFPQGHGIHLAANSLSNTCHSANGIKSLCEGSPQLQQYIAALDWFDELVSHILWIGGIMLFCVALLRTQVLSVSKHGNVIKYAGISFFQGILFVLFGLVYGVLFACHNIEGGTVAMGLPFCVAIVGYLMTWKRELVSVSPISLLFLVSHIFTLALFFIWYWMWGGFPEFSQLKGGIGSFYATTLHKTEL